MMMIQMRDLKSLYSTMMLAASTLTKNISKLPEWEWAIDISSSGDTVSSTVSNISSIFNTSSSGTDNIMSTFAHDKYRQQQQQHY